MEKGIRQTIEEWTKAHAVKYHDSTTDISPTKQLEALSSLFSSLKEQGFSPESVIAHMQMIASPLAPRDIKSLKKIRKYRSYSAEDASETLSRWCGAASENIVESFNSVFYIGTEESLSGRPIYEWMCRKRNIRPITSVTSNPSHNDIEEHLHAEPIEGLGVVKKKNNNFTIGTTLLDDTLENVMKKYKPFTPNPKNIFNEFPEISGPSKEALEFFGISDIPKEKL